MYHSLFLFLFFIFCKYFCRMRLMRLLGIVRVGMKTGELGLSESVGVLWLGLVMCGEVRESESLLCW